MENKFQASFIPKNPVVIAGSNIKVERPISLFSLLGTIIFLLAISSSVGLYAYEKILNQQILDMKESIAAQIKEFDPSLVDVLTKIKAQIDFENELLTNHVASSQLFDILGDFTLKNIQFKDMDFSAGSVSVNGTAKSYNDVAYQSEVLSKKENVKSYSFSNVKMDEKGSVNFSMKAVINSPALLYKELLSVKSSTTTEQ